MGNLVRYRSRVKFPGSRGEIPGAFLSMLDGKAEMALWNYNGLSAEKEQTDPL
jgi:hypothetical protein